MSFFRAVLLAVLAAFASSALAQPYPNRSIRLVIPFPPGGTNEQLGRVISVKLQERWGQPVVMENRAGAGGNIGATAVAKSAPDGYTLLFGTNTLTMNKYIFANMPFDPEKDLAPVAMIGSTPFAVVVNNNLPVRSVGELIAYAKANPGKLSFGSAGVGTPHHLGAELFKNMAGINMVHIPYKGSAAALTDVMSGQIPLMWITINVAMPLINAGKVRAIAVGDLKRLSWAQHLPTIAETVPGYEVSAWYAVFAPTGTPTGIIDALSTEIQSAFNAAGVRERMPQGVDLSPAGPKELGATMTADIAKWGKVVAAAGIKPE